MFRLALDSLGGIYEHADLIVTLGHDKKKPSRLPRRWKPFLSKKVTFYWASPDEFRQSSYLAQGDKRWQLDYSAYDVVIFCDADVLIVEPIDDLLLLTLESPAVTGAITHYAFQPKENVDPHTVWHDLASRFLNRPLEFNYRHTLSVNNLPEYTFCPFYINFGFVVFTPALYNQFNTQFLDVRPKVVSALADPYFSAQITLALVVEMLQVPTREIGLRYNFPNDKNADRIQEHELDDVRVIHYLRTNQFDRQKLFTSKKHFQEFLSLDLDGSDKVFQEYVMALTGNQYPF